MQRRIGALPNARAKVREAFTSLRDLKGIKWRNCLEFYREGQNEGHRNEAVCDIDAHKPGYHVLVKEAIPVLCIVLMIYLVSIVPFIGRFLVGGLTAAVVGSGIVSIMAWERWAVLYNCKLGSAQSV